MTTGLDRSAYIATRRLLASILLLFCLSLFTGCEKTDDPGPVIGTVKKGDRKSIIKNITILQDEKRKLLNFSLY